MKTAPLFLALLGLSLLSGCNDPNDLWDDPEFCDYYRSCDKECLLYGHCSD